VSGRIYLNNIKPIKGALYFTLDILLTVNMISFIA